jgi:hypothetical protein
LLSLKNSRASKTRYNTNHVQKKHIGFDSLKRYRGMKPQRHHSLAAFSLSSPFMAAQMGDSQESAGFAPRFASLSTRLSRRHCLTASATVVLNQLEHDMANASSSAPAQINKVNYELRDLKVEADHSLQCIAALAWVAGISMAHVVDRGTVAGAIPHLQAVLSQIQASAEILGDNLEFRLQVIQGALPAATTGGCL